MNEFLSTWLFDLGRVTLVLTGVALAVGIALRLTRPTTPRLHRTAWCMVLLVGWLFVRYPISIPWYESAPVENEVVADMPVEPVTTTSPEAPAPLEMLAESPATVDLPDPHPSQATGLTTVEPVVAKLVPIEPIAVAPSPSPQVQAGIEATASIPDTNPPATLVPPTPSQTTTATFNWPTVLCFIWLAGIIVSLFHWLSGYVRSIRSMSTALLPDEASCRQWQALLEEHKIDREIPLRLTENMGPLLCRWPDGYELVVPAKFWESLSPSVRLGVMRHELAHYQRGDVWKSLAMRILALPHWFNPAAWWAVRRFEEAAEWACDEAAIDANARSTDYARTLLALAEASLGGGSCHPSMSRWNLSARIRRLVTSPNRKDSIMKKMTLASLAMLLLGICLVRIDLVAKTSAVADKPAEEAVEISDSLLELISIDPLLISYDKKSIVKGQLKLKPASRKLLLRIAESFNAEHPLDQAVATTIFLAGLENLAKLSGSYFHSPESSSVAVPMTMAEETSQFLKDLTWQAIRNYHLNGYATRLVPNISLEDASKLDPATLRGPWPKFYYELTRFETFAQFITEAAENEDESLSKPAKAILAEVKQIEETINTSETATETIATPPLPVTSAKTLRYDGKTFEEWKETLATELSTDTRVEAIKAMAAFGARGYGKEAAEVIVGLMRESGANDIKRDYRSRLMVASAAAFSGKSTGFELADTINLAEGLPVLCRELKEGNQKSCDFALFTLCLLSRNNLGNQAKDVTSAVAEFIRQNRGKGKPHPAYEILLKVDPTGDTTAAIAREGFAKAPSEYPPLFVKIAMFFITENAGLPDHGISPGECGVIRVVSECLAEDRPTSVRHAAMLDLARFLACFDTPLKSKLPSERQAKGGARPISNETLKFGKEMMGRLVTANASQLKFDFKIYQTLRTYAPNNSRICGMAEQAWTEAHKAALEKPSDASLAKREEVARNIYWVVATPPAYSKPMAASKQFQQLVYEIDEAYTDPVNMKKIVTAVQQRVCRIAPSSVAYLSARQQITVVVNKDDEKKLAQIEQVLSRPGTLEFRILANRHDHEKLITQAEKEKGDKVLDKQGKRLAWWVPVYASRTDEFAYDENFVTRTVEKDGRSCTEILVVSDPHNVTDEFLKQAKMVREVGVHPSIRFSLNETGGERFGKLTGENQPDVVTGARRRLAIILDGKLYSAPAIMSRITTDGIIHGSFTEQEATEIANVLNSGSLPTPLKQVSSESIMMNETPAKPVKAEPSPELSPKPDPSKPTPVKPTATPDKPQDGTYRIEPPDIVRVELDKVVPKSPYRLGVYDVIRVNSINTILTAPINGHFLIEPEGNVCLGPVYGRVKVVDMTLDEAEKAILKHLETILKGPKVSVELERAAGMPPIKGYYQVGPDGMINLKRYGRVHVADKTIAEATMLVQEHLAKHLQSPKVSIDVGKYQSKHYYLVIRGDSKTDEIMSIPLTGNETALDAIALLKNNFDASKVEIQIARPNANGKGGQLLDVDCFKLTTSDNNDFIGNYPLQPNDRVLVRYGETTEFRTQPKLPHEGSMITLPAYRIEPPDLIQIDGVKLIPINQKITSGDVVQIDAINMLIDAPINGYHKVDAEGRVSLGPAYGKVKVTGMSPKEAEKAIVKHLETIVKNPEVTVQMVKCSGVKPITGIYLVGPDGTVPLRSYGSVNVSGKTVNEARKAIEKHLSKSLLNPIVSVDVTAYNSKVFYVIQGDDKLGDNIMTLPITGRETVLDALSRTQGLRDLSKASIRLVRVLQDKSEKSLPIDYEAIITGLDTTTNYQILPGDRLYVEVSKAEKE